MKILAFDHFFGQDLDALEGALGPHDVLVKVPYRRWHRLAHRFFPPVAFSGLERAYHDDLDSAWVDYRLRVAREVNWLCRAHRPDLLLLPSDSFFYVRPFIEEFRRNGVPTFVMQKETTISPMVMEEHSVQVGRLVPFMSDFMTVCSERHREFWLRAGTDPGKVAVTGQPRFDVYADKRVRLEKRPKSILFLSYDDSAYLPSDIGVEFDGSWRELRLETEQVISEFAREWNVVVKEHPQQGVAETNLDSRVVRADRYADTRDLIRGCDVVIGFQTTAIYEAAVCGKPVIYPAWGRTFERVRSTLNPFENVPGLVHWVQNANELRETLRLASGGLPVASDAARRESEVHLGPVDGKASERTIEYMRKIAHAGDVPGIDVVMLLCSTLKATTGPLAKCAELLLRVARPELSRRLGRVASENLGVFREVLLTLRRRSVSIRNDEGGQVHG